MVILAGGGLHVSWFVGNDAGHRWVLLIVGSEQSLWLSLPVVVAGCDWRWWLVVVGGGGWLWLVVVAGCGQWWVASCGRPWLGGGVISGWLWSFGGWSVLSQSNESLGVCWLVMWLATSSLLSLLVAVVSGWLLWWEVAAVGDGDDMAGLGCFR